jgi:hypothetical protein
VFLRSVLDWKEKKKSTRDYVLEENLLDVKKLLNKCEYLTDSENEDGE